MGASEWETYDDRPLLGAVYGAARVRSFAFGLRDGGLCVASPGGRDDERFAALERWGGVRFLLASNAYHNLGLATWKERFPAAKVVAHPRALPRLRKRLPKLGVEDLTGLEAALPDGIRLLSPPMARQGETWVSAKMATGTAWYVTDAIVNQTALPSGPTGLVLRTVGFRTRLMTNPLFKRIFVDSKAAYRTWTEEQLQQDPPTLFVPAHGEVLRGPDVVQRLLEVTRSA